MIIMYRQGDLLFEKVERRNEGFSELVKNNIIAEGEIKGHKHILENGKVYKEKNAGNGQAYLVLEKPSQVTHDEHNPIPLEEGVYKVSRQREFNGEYYTLVSD